MIMNQERDWVMKIKKYFKKSSITTLTVAMVFSTGMMHFNTNAVHAASFTGTLSNVVSATVDNDDAYVIYVNFNDQV